MTREPESAAPSSGGETAASSGQEFQSASRGMVTFSVMFCTFIAVLDSTIVNVAMKHMRGAFGVDLSTITWVASSYSIAQVIMIVMSAWWSTLLGRKRFLLISIAVFTVGSMMSGTATTFNEMMIYRVIQGIGGGSLVPLSQAILRESYPPKLQGAAMARFGMGVVMAPAIGPMVGGYLTEEFGWPWIFYISVPFAIFGFIMVSIYVKDPPYLKRGIRKIDWGGIVFLIVGLTGVQLFLERGQEENWFDSTWITWVAVITVTSLAVMIWWELREEEPIVDFRVLKNVQLSVGSSMMLIFGIAQFGTTFILPQFLLDLLAYSPSYTGLIMAPRGIMLFITLAVVGRLFQYVDRRIFIPVGVGLIIAGMVVFSRLSLEADFWTMLPGLILLGMGAPCIFITMSTVALGSVPPEQATAASGIFNLARRMGGNIGFALLTTILERRIAYHRINLLSNINNLNEAFVRFKSGLGQTLIQKQVPLHMIDEKSYAMIERMIDRQATMLAYNDLYIFLGWLFVAIVPLVLLLKARSDSVK